MLLKDSKQQQRTTKQDKVALTRATHDQHLKDAEKRATDTVAADGDMNVMDMHQRLGRSYMGTALIKVLSRLNSNLIFERSLADNTKVGIYIMKDVRNPQTWSWSRKRVFIVGMEAHINPEYSVIVPQTERVPTDPHGGEKDILKYGREIRGWRTVLFRLLKAGLLTEPQIESVFKVSQNNAKSKHWQDRMSAGGIITSTV